MGHDATNLYDLGPRVADGQLLARLRHARGRRRLRAGALGGTVFEGWDVAACRRRSSSSVRLVVPLLGWEAGLGLSQEAVDVAVC